MNSNEPARVGAARRGLIVAIGAVGVAGLLVVAIAIGAPMLRADETATTTIRKPTPVRTPSAAPSDEPTRTSLPARVEKLRVRVLFGVQSVGADIAKGIPAAYSAAHVRKPKVTTWRKADKVKGAVVATAPIGRNGKPMSKLRDFAALVNDAPRNSIDVAVMAFDYQDITATTDVDNVFESYAATMDSIETANPDVTFLYATVPVSRANSWRSVDRAQVKGLHEVDQPVWQDNIARERLNALIRDQYASTGRLFDIAALQARLGEGKVAAKQHEGQWYYVMNPALTSDGKRLSRSGSTQLAQGLMRLVSAVGKQ